jgi:Protein of unknown function (DUF3625).
MKRYLLPILLLAAAPVCAEEKAVHNNGEQKQEAGRVYSPKPVREPVPEVQIPQRPIRHTGVPEELLDAYEKVKQLNLPMTESMVRDFKATSERTKRAAMDPAIGVPDYEPRSANLSVAPGAKSIELRISALTSPNFTTTVVFIDSTGAPWKVMSAQGSNGDELDVIIPNQGGNSVSVTPLKDFVHGSVTVTLEGLPLSIAMKATYSPKVVDSVVTVRVAARGPNAKPVIMETPPPEAGSEVIMSFLDGVAPDGAKLLKVTGLPIEDARAWSLGGQIYLRTSATVLSPAWVNSVSSADGTSVFVLPDTPVVLSSYQGRMINLRISERSIQ